jgi:hypothetical protein
VFETADRIDATEVFVCYRVDKSGQDAALLRRALRDRYVNVCVDFGALEPGDRWEAKLEKALDSTQLAVGVILMTHDWFTQLNDAGDLESDPVWHETQRLLERTAADEEIAIYSIYVCSTGQPVTRLPSLPPDVRPEVRRLEQQLLQFQTLPIVRRGDLEIDDIASSIADRVLRRSLEGTVFGKHKAAATPPQPLFRLGQSERLRRGLRRFADREIALRGETFVTLTLQGQDELLARRFESALAHLQRAWRDVDIERWSSRHAVEERAWCGHAANLLVVASLRGQRPRRRRIFEATYLLHGVLIPALHAQAGGLDRWPELESEPDLDESARSVAELSIGLLWLLWSDYFLERNVMPRESDPRLRGLDDVLRALWRRLDAGRGNWADEELNFLFEGYLDGLGDSPSERRIRQLDDLGLLVHDKPWNGQDEGLR